MEQRGFIHRARLLWVFDQRLDLRREAQAVRALGVIDRLDADAIAHEPQPALLIVPDGEAEHSAKAAEAVDSPFAEGEQQHFGVRMIGPPVAAAKRLDRKSTRLNSSH